MKSKVAETTLGHRTINGADWPVKNIVYRDGPREWVVSYAVCNGSADRAEVYRTKREALEAAGIR